MPIYTYRCRDCGHSEDMIRPMSVERVQCDCGGEAPRSGANRIAVVGPPIDSRNMFRRFTEASAEMDYAATKIEADTGRAIETPDYWGAAKERAAAIERAGENTLQPLHRET